MFNRLRYSTLFLGWRARRAGALDGAALIPAGGDGRPPKYLLYLRSIGNWQAGNLEWRWKLHERVLYPAYVRASRLAEQAEQALEQLSREHELAQQRRLERGTEKNIKALRRAERVREAARRRAARARLKLDSAMARRQAKWRELRARFLTMAATFDQYMQIYSAANVKARDQNECPPGLLDENCPRPEMPPSLQTLSWELPSASAVRESQGPTFSA